MSTIGPVINCIELVAAGRACLRWGLPSNMAGVAVSDTAMLHAYEMLAVRLPHHDVRAHSAKRRLPADRQ